MITEGGREFHRTLRSFGSALLTGKSYSFYNQSRTILWFGDDHMKNVIYYFSGTGNSMRTARVIAQRLGDTELISMRADPKRVSAIGYETVGFVFPVYHWTLPAPVLAFVEDLQVGIGSYVFVIAVPALVCGIACEKLAEVLKKKNVQIDYGCIVHAVANYALVYPPFPPEALTIPKMEKKLKQAAEEIAMKKKKAYPRSASFIKLLRERIMSPYMELMPYADQPFTVNEECISCGLCARVCPCHNIEMKEGRPVFLHHCSNCMACFASCPKRAIGWSFNQERAKDQKDRLAKAPVVRIMGLPDHRKLYRNPYITSDDLCKEKEIICPGAGMLVNETMSKGVK